MFGVLNINHLFALKKLQGFRNSYLCKNNKKRDKTIKKVRK